MARIALLLVLLLAGGGAGAYWYFGVAPAQAAAEPAPPPPPPGPSLTLEPIVLPVIRDGRVVRLATFVLSVELAAGRQIAAITSRLPRLQDAYLTELAFLLSLDWPGGVAIDLDTARQRLLARTARIYVDGEIARVLFAAVHERVV